MTDWVFDPLERGAYDVVCADPPWYFRGYSNAVGNRDVRRHYPVMKIGDISDLPVSELAAKDALLFLWATGPCLPQAFDVMKAWGFRYSGIAFTWVKFRRGFDPQQLRLASAIDADLHFGGGYTTRKNCEFVLLGRRGSPRGRQSKSVREVILAPVREHSRKPEEFRDRVEAYAGSDARIAEIFARSERPNWDSWGNETTKFEVATAA